MDKKARERFEKMKMFEEEWGAKLFTPDPNALPCYRDRRTITHAKYEPWHSNPSLRPAKN